MVNTLPMGSHKNWKKQTKPPVQEMKLSVQWRGSSQSWIYPLPYYISSLKFQNQRTKKIDIIKKQAMHLIREFSKEVIIMCKKYGLKNATFKPVRKIQIKVSFWFHLTLVGMTRSQQQIPANKWG